jgi:hypothetical protein
MTAEHHRRDRLHYRFGSCFDSSAAGALCN